MKESYRRHLDMLNEKHGMLLESLNQLIKALPQNNEDAVKAHTKKANLLSNVLIDSLATKDQPVWLRAINSYSKSMINQSKTKHNIDSLYPHLLGARSHVWALEQAFIDFDEIYIHFRDKNDLPTLLDKVIEALKKIHDSDEIDRIKVIEAIEQLMLMLNNGAKGSYLSLNGALTFTKSLLGNFLWEALSEIPGIGALVRALRRSLEELDKGVSKLHEDMNENISQKTENMNRIPSISYSLVYDKEGIAASLPELPLISESA